MRSPPYRVRSCPRWRVPPSRFWAGSKASATPSEDAVFGMSCMSPCAPFGETACGRKPDSTDTTAITRSGSRPWRRAAAAASSRRSPPAGAATSSRTSSGTKPRTAEAGTPISPPPLRASRTRPSSTRWPSSLRVSPLDRSAISARAPVAGTVSRSAEQDRAPHGPQSMNTVTEPSMPLAVVAVTVTVFCTPPTGAFVTQGVPRLPVGVGEAAVPRRSPGSPR